MRLLEVPTVLSSQVAMKLSHSVLRPLLLLSADINKRQGPIETDSAASLSVVEPSTRSLPWLALRP